MANNIEPSSMLMGWIAGECVKSMLSKKPVEPVAYLYNGVRLPKLPEWDRGRYPYAVISKFDDYWTFGIEGNIWAVYAFSEPLIWIETDTPYLCLMGTDIISGLTDSAAIAEDWSADWLVHNAWGAWAEEHDEDGNGAKLDQVFWTNTDIYNPDGTVYLSASEPVPVYE